MKLTKKSKLVLTFVVSIACYAVFRILVEQEFNAASLIVFLLPIYIVMFSLIKPRLERDPVAVIKFEQEHMEVKGKKFRIDSINKIAIDETPEYATFSLPYNQVDANVISFLFDKQQIGEVKEHIKGNIPHVDFIR